MASKSSGSKRSTPPRTSRRNYVPLQPEQLLPTATSSRKGAVPASRAHGSSNRAKGQGAATHGSRVWGGQATTTAVLEAAQRGIDEEDVLLDSYLSSLHLARKHTPKDGACLFRAVAEHVYHTQALHGVVREECVGYLQEHHKDFAAFICVNGRPYEDYVNKMRKATTWGGEVELQALSSLYQVNFEIHQLGEQVMKIDNGFPVTYRLCFSHGNHYDIVYPESTMDGLRLCQSLVYELVDRAFWRATTATSSNSSSSSSSSGGTVTSGGTTQLPSLTSASEAPSDLVVSRAVGEGPPSRGEWTYRNVELECWIEETRQREIADILLAQSLALSGGDDPAAAAAAAAGAGGKAIVSNTHSFPALKSAAPVLSAATDHRRTPEPRGPSAVELLVRAVTEEQKQYAARIKLPTDEASSSSSSPSDSSSHPMHHEPLPTSLPGTPPSSSSGGQVTARPDVSSAMATGDALSSSSSSSSPTNASATSGRKGAPRSPAPGAATATTTTTTTWGAKRDWKQHLQQPPPPQQQHPQQQQQQRQPSPTTTTSCSSSSSKSSNPPSSASLTSVVVATSVRVGGTHGHVSTTQAIAANPNIINTNTISSSNNNNNSAMRGSAAVCAPSAEEKEEEVVVVVGEQQLGPLAASSTNGKVLLPPELCRTPAAAAATASGGNPRATTTTTTTPGRGSAAPVLAIPTSVSQKYSPSIPPAAATAAVTATIPDTNNIPSSSSSSPSHVCLSFGAFQQQVVAVVRKDALSSQDLAPAAVATAGSSNLSQPGVNNHKQARPVSVVGGVGMEELEPLDIVFGDFGAPGVNESQQPFKPAKPDPVIVQQQPERPGSNRGHLDDARSGGRRGRSRVGSGERSARDGASPKDSTSASTSSKASPPSSLVNHTERSSSKNGRGGNRGAAQQAPYAAQPVYHHSQQQQAHHHQAPPTSYVAHATGAAYYSSSDRGQGSGAHYGIAYDGSYLPTYALPPPTHPHPHPPTHPHHGVPPPPHYPQPGYLVDSYPVYYAPPAGLPPPAGYGTYVQVPYDHVVSSPAFYGPPFEHYDSYNSYDPYEYDTTYPPQEQSSTEPGASE